MTEARGSLPFWRPLNNPIGNVADKHEHNLNERVDLAKLRAACITQLGITKSLYTHFCVMGSGGNIGSTLVSTHVIRL